MAWGPIGFLQQGYGEHYHIPDGIFQRTIRMVAANSEQVEMQDVQSLELQGHKEDGQLELARHFYEATSQFSRCRQALRHHLILESVDHRVTRKLMSNLDCL